MFGRGSQNRRWQKRPKLYRGRFFKLKLIAQLVIAVFAAIILTIGFVTLRNSGVLALKHVVVAGELKHMSEDDVIALSGLKPGQSLFDLSLDAMSARLARHPWIRRASATRRFPDTVVIGIEEREPMALLALDKLFLVDADGHVFKEWQPGDVKNLPVISGLDPAVTKKYPALARHQLGQCLEFLKQTLASDAFEQDPVAKIIYDPAAGFAVTTAKSKQEIFFGKNDFVAKLQRLVRFQQTDVFRKSHFVRLDLDKADRVIARSDN